LGNASVVPRGVVFLAAEDAGFVTGAWPDATGAQYMATRDH
jgi:hypothetical protein